MANKKVIVERIGKKIDISSTQSNDFFKSFLNLIASNARIGTMKIANFGTFRNHITPKRIGRNPKTKESYIIHPKNKIIFKPANSIKFFFNNL